MALFHHGGGGYTEAAGEAAARGRVIIEEQIHKGRQSAVDLIERVQAEVPTDIVSPARGFRFTPSDDVHEPVRLHLDNVPDGIDVPDEGFGIARHAYGQITERLKFPRAWGNKIAEQPWGRELIAHNLRELSQQDDGRRLVRVFDKRARGVMSDRFRRIDNRPCLDAVCAMAGEMGFVPMEGVASETRVSLRALMPRVFEPYTGEVLAYGFQWNNSNYGHGAHSVSIFVFRTWCTNLCTGDEVLRDVHLGKRLSADIQYSAKTYQLDTDATVSALQDTIRHMLGPDNVQHMNQVIANAASEVLTPGAIKRKLDDLGKTLRVSEIEAVRDAFNGADVEMLPPGNTTWRLSNALSWVAGNTDDPERKIELQQLAAKPLPKLLPRAA